MLSIKPKATFKTEHVLFKMKNTVCFSTMVKMSECLREENIDAYMNLTDDIIRVILHPPPYPGPGIPPGPAGAGFVEGPRMPFPQPMPLQPGK